MTNQNEEDDVAEVDEIVPTVDDDGNDTTDWKTIAEERQELARKNHGIAQRYKTKLAKVKESVVESKTAPKTESPKADAEKSSELDSGSKALLVAYGIKGKDELALAQSFMQRTGDDIDSVVEDDIFQAKLTKLREIKASQQAVPTGTKRSAASTKDSVEYHLEKYESGQTKLEDMPFDMRAKVLTAKLEKDKNASTFAFSSNG